MPGREHAPLDLVPPAALDSSLELVVCLGPELQRVTLPRDGTVTIGRAAENEIVIDDPSVSRRHAILRVESGDVAAERSRGASGPAPTPESAVVTIEDCGSANGTRRRDDSPSGETADLTTSRFAAGERVTVSIGECVLLGSVTLVLRRASHAVSARPAEPDARSGAAATDSVVVRSARMRETYALAERVAPSPLNVLILGETGTGKEVLAEFVHRRSPRANGPLLRLNCAALSETLLESELFGHERGAFTGAQTSKPGLFETANGGTVFLDEIGELSASTQAKLLRVLEDRKVMRVGGLKPRDIDVRFVSATHRDLDGDVATGRFRRDLLFRLNGITITLPPLRERTDEVVALAELFALRASLQMARSRAPVFSPEAIAALEAHDWPGNVRELRNVVERAVVLCDGERIREADLLLPTDPGRKSADTRAPVVSVPVARSIGASNSQTVRPPAFDGLDPAVTGSIRRELQDLEKQRIVEALEKCDGNQTRAAESLGIARRTLIARIESYGLPRPRKDRR